MSKARDLMREVNAVLGDDLVKMGDDPSLAVQYLSTGILPMDVLLEGGIPRNRFTEVFGDYSTLKSYIGLTTAARVQASGGVAALIDTEHAFDPAWAADLGVNVDELIYEAPQTGEMATDITEVLVRSGVDLVVWDSVAATLPQAEQRKRLHGETVQLARLAALMSLAMRKLTAANTRTALLFINQTRINVGQMFGSPETVPGGRALPFYSAYRIALRKGGRITTTVDGWDGEKKVKVKRTTGVKIRATVEKSKLSAPHRETWFVYDLERGRVDDTGFLMTYGLEKGVITQEGSWWKYRDQTKVGAQRFRGLLDQDPKVREALMTDLGCPGVAAPVKKMGTPRRRKSSDV